MFHKKIQVFSIMSFSLLFVHFLYSGVCSDLVMQKCWKRVMKVVAPPTEWGTCVLIGTFFTNYDVTNRKLKHIGTHSTVQKRTKRKENNVVETTIEQKIGQTCRSYIEHSQELQPSFQPQEWKQPWKNNWKLLESTPKPEKKLN